MTRAKFVVNNTQMHAYDIATTYIQSTMQWKKLIAFHMRLLSLYCCLYIGNGRSMRSNWKWL